MGPVFHDVRQAVRSLVRRPAASVLAVAVLALGIGANAAIFSLVDAVLFRALPVARLDRLVRLFSASSELGAESGRVSLPFVDDYRSAASSIASLEIWSDRLPVDVVLEGRSAARLSAAVVSPGFFESLGVRPALGRLLDRDDAEPAAMAVVSHRLWQSGFGRDPRAVGAIVLVNRQPFVIVGVAPSGFEGLGLEAPDIWLPLSQVGVAMPAWRDQTRHRSSTFFNAVGRLKPGIDLAAARVELKTIAARLGAGQRARQAPEVEDPGWHEPWPRIEPAGAEASRGTRALARLLAGIAGLVLALACADVAGLMLARAEGRRRELAVRAALGASRWQVVRPLVFEALVVSVTGTLAGVVVAHVSIDLLLATAPAELRSLLAARSSVLGPRVLGAAVALAALATLLSGVWPAFRAARLDPMAGLRNEPPAGAARWISTRGALVAFQVGVATVLLIGVGVLARSVWTAARIDPGIDPRSILAVDLDLPRGGYGKAEGAAFAAHLEEVLSHSRGVTAAALSVGAPLERGLKTTVTIDGSPTPIDFMMVTPAFFEALGLPLVRGRAFDRGDGGQAAPVAVVNRAFVHRFWPGADPIGRHIAGFTPRNAVLVVVGVVADMRAHGLREPVRPVLYVPLARFYDAFPWTFGLTALIRTQEDFQPGTALLASTVHTADPMLPVLRPRRLATALGEPFRQQRLLFGLLGAFAVLALLLAGTGLYGVVALATEARRREFAVRVALGALPWHVRRLVHGRCLSLCGLGLAGGTAAALAARQALQPFVFGVSSIDPLALAATLVVLLLVSLVCAAGPARRAAAVEPGEALRQE